MDKQRSWLSWYFLLPVISLLSACGGGGGGDGSVTGQNPVAIDDTPRFAYVINNSVIGSYVVDPVSGNLIPKGNSQRFFEVTPADIAPSPDGRFFYLSDRGGFPAIKRRKIDPQTGVFSTDSGDYRVNAPGAHQILIHPSGKFLFYRSNGTYPITTLAIDPSTGDLSLADETAPLSTARMDLSADGNFLYTMTSVGDWEIRTFRIGTNGSLVMVDADPVTAGNQPQVFSNIAGRPGLNPVNRYVYLVNLGGSGSVDRYAPDGSGLLEPVDSTPIPDATVSFATAQGMYVEPKGRFAYVRLANNLIAGFSVDPVDGVLSPIDYDPASGGIQHLDFGSQADRISTIGFEPSGRFVYFGFSGAGGVTLEKYAIDQMSGMLSQDTSKTELNRILGLGRVSAMIFTNRTNVPPPQPTYAYSRQNGLIGIHRVDAATGTLTDIDTFVTPAYRQLYIDPAQHYLYLAESSAYARVQIDQDTGALSGYETKTNAIPGLGQRQQGLRFEPHNRFALQTRQNGRGTDFMQVVAGGLGTASTGVHFSQAPYTLTGIPGSSDARPNSRHLYSTGLVSGTSGSNAAWVMRVFELVATPVTFDRVDASPGTAGHQDYPLGRRAAAYDTAVEPLGRYLLNLELTSSGNTDNLAVYELEWATGVPTRRNALSVPLIIPNHTTGSNPLHIMFDPRGRFVYVPTDDGIAAFRFTRNPVGAALALIDLYPTLGGNRRLAIDPTGQWLFSPGSAGTEGFRIDQGTGELTSVGIVSPTITGDLKVIGNL